MWHTANYEGEYAFGQNGVLTNAIYELCLAVNERQMALDVPLTEFKDKDGNLGTFLSLEAITGTFITGEDNPFSHNCAAVMAWIHSAVGNAWFMEEPSVSSSVWTPESMEADIGLGSLWLSSIFPTTPSSPCDYLFFQRCQEALNRMIYVVARNRYDNTTPRAITGSVSDGYVQLADAWTNRYDNPYPPTATGGSAELTISLQYDFTDAVATTETQLLVPFSKDKYLLGPSVSGLGSATIDGVIVEAYAAVNRIRTSNGPIGYNVSFGNLVVDGEGVPWPLTSLPVSPINEFVFEYARLHQIESPSLTEDFEIPVVLGEPFSFSSGTTFSDYAILAFVEVYVDISSELTDQT